MVAAKKSFPVLATLVTFVAVVIMLNLGLWQLDRMEQKEQRLDTLMQRQAQSSIDLLSLSDETQGLADIPVRFVGTPMSNQYLLLDNRIYNGTVGYELLVLVETNAGVVLVNYGWIEAGESRQVLPTVVIPSGQQEYAGNVVEPSDNPMIRETIRRIDAYPVVIQQIDIPLLERLTGETLLPYIVSREPQSTDPYVRNWQPVVMPPAKHMGYAIQWFGLAIAATLIYLFAVFKRKSSRD